MIQRKIEAELASFFAAAHNKALLITGARQVGKTYSIRQYGKAHFKSFVEINLIENSAARKLFAGAGGSADLLMRLSAIADQPLIPGQTLIFFDEVQECKEIVTAIKFLVDEGSYRYVLSGSLLGVELQDIRSVPVGYMEIRQMFPLDFEEFAVANGVSRKVLDALRDAFSERRPADDFIHEKMMEVFRLYLIVGGMPAAVMQYLKTNNLKAVIQEQRGILALYKKDISKYDPENKLYIEDIFELIPSELNAKNKRFILKDLHDNFKFSRYKNSFLWLENAGVALPTHCVSEPEYPLRLMRSVNLFKLFLSDVGLLASMYMDDVQIKILNREKDINFGSVYENAAAQEPKCHGFDLYYFNSKKQGEIDFLVEQQGNVVPVEIKSGKDYTKHAALDHVVQNPQYGIREAFVFHNGNLHTEGIVTYCPVYMLMFLNKESFDTDMIYRLDLDGLK